VARLAALHRWNTAKPIKRHSNRAETFVHISVGKHCTLSYQTQIGSTRLGMVRTNYSFEKRQRELATKKKKEEKRQQKSAARRSKIDNATPSLAVDDPTVE